MSGELHVSVDDAAKNLPGILARLANNSKDIQALVDAGHCCNILGHDEDSLNFYRRASVLHDDPWTHLNFGLMLNQHGRYDEAMPHIHHAYYMQNPVSDYVGVSYAEMLCREGLWEEGFKIFEQFRQSKRWFVLNDTLTEWTGQSINGKTLYVALEGGYGDAIINFRYIPKLESMGAKVVLGMWTDMIPLLEQQDWAKQREQTAKPDMWVSCVSLPNLLGERPESVLWNGPYIKAPETWTYACKPNVGLCWAAGERMSPRRIRSLSPVQAKRLMDVDGIHWVSLQKDESLDADWVAAPMSNWLETANSINGLDLVISMDTAVAHLAGAMGKPVWLVVGGWSDWKWLRNRSDSPWYPSMRIFRNEGLGFDNVVEQVRKALDEAQYTE